MLRIACSGVVICLGLFAAACGGGGGGEDPCLPMQTSISENLTLPEGCYLAEDTVYVSGSAVLTLEPGVEIRFSQDTLLEVDSASALHAVGTADKPILLTGATKNSGFWTGVRLSNANSLDNRLEYVTIEYAGAQAIAGNVRANLALDSSGYPVQMAIAHSTLREGGGYGFYLAEEAVLSAFADNAVTANTAGAGWVYAEAAGNLDDSSTFSGNGQDVVFVESAYGLDNDQTWAAIDADYLLDDQLLVYGHLTIAPGARLVFQQDAGLSIESDAALTASGTAQAPILFTGEQKQRGFWSGIQLNNSNSVDNRLDYVTIEYGGSSDITGDGVFANLALDSSGYPVRMQVTHSTLRESGGYGFYLDEDAILPAFTDNTITANTDGAGWVYAEAAGNLDGSSTYSGNDQDVVFVECAYGMDIDQTWPAIDADYLLHDILLIYSHLTVAPGARLVFQQDAGLSVESDAALTAAGSSTQPILFTGEQALPGFWAGIVFSNSNHVENTFDYVTVEYAGSNEFTSGFFSAIALDSSGFPVSLQLTHSTIQHSGGWGLWLAQESVVNADVDTSNTFSGNQDGDIYREP